MVLASLDRGILGKLKHNQSSLTWFNAVLKYMNQNQNNENNFCSYST